MEKDTLDDLERMARRRAQMREHLRSLAGINDPSGVELIHMIRCAANICDALEARACDDSGLTGPRFGVLMRLLVDEVHGHAEGVTPTSLSHLQSVSKNTISALLRGLEEQGLIRRTLDPQDLRIFRIQLTNAGRELVQSTAPLRMRTVNELASGLAADEREQLMVLLGKLMHSLRDRIDDSRTEFPGG